MLEGFDSYLGEIGISITLLIIIIIWTIFWKLIALWHSARKGHLVWFVVIALFNTIGILPILYLFIFKDLKIENKQIKKKKQIQNKKKTISKKKK